MYSKKYRIVEIEEFNGHNPIYENAKGCVCYPAYLKVGERGWLLYEVQLEDEFMAYPHRLRTSVIKDVQSRRDNSIVVTTENTRLVLKVIVE